MTDRRTVLAVVYLLGALAVVGLVGVIGLVALGKPPEAVAIVVGLAGPPAGALSALLVSTRTIVDPPAPVTVTNTDAEPIPVAETPAVDDVSATEATRRASSRDASGPARALTGARRR
jgi:hypothetical protein